MAQLRQDYDQFVSQGAEILVIGPEGPNAFKRYWENEQLPFRGLADIGSKVAGRFYQEVNLFKLGRMPAIFIIDMEGIIRFYHYGDSMSDIPANQDILAVLAEIVRGEQASTT